MTQTAVIKFYKDLEKYAVIKDSQFILNIPLVLMSELFEQAKEMEKQQIIDAFYQCGIDNFEHIKVINRSATDYYSETYGSKGSDEIEKSEKPINLTSSQTEISDDEIEKEIKSRYETPHYIKGFCDGAIWYRKQLKKK